MGDENAGVGSEVEDLDSCGGMLVVVVTRRGREKNLDEVHVAIAVIVYAHLEFLPVEGDLRRTLVQRAALFIY